MCVHHHSSRDRLAIGIAHVIMTPLVPLDCLACAFAWVFKLPIIFYRAGVPLFNDRFHLLTTVGRTTSTRRTTPLEYCGG